MHPTRRDLMIRLLEGSENPISALFNFYAGKTSEKLVLPTIVCQIDGILQHLHCWKCFQEKDHTEHFIRLQTIHASALITILLSPEYFIYFLPIVCIKTQKSGSHSEQFRMSEDEYTLRPGFSELFLTSIVAWILDCVPSEVNA